MIAARFKSNWLRKVVLALAIAAAIHFLFSSLHWIILIYFAVRMRWDLVQALLGSIPAILFLVWFSFVLYMTLRRIQLAAWLLAAGLVASAAVFTYDVTTWNFQMHAENYHGTGHQKTFYYATWWWYDESWFRS